MKKYKKMLTIIVSIIILLIILIIVLISRISKKEKDVSNIFQGETSSVINSTGKNSENQQGISRENYFAVKKAIENYYYSIYTILNFNSNAGAGEIAEDDLKAIRENQNKQYENIYNTLSQEYINAYNITKENIKDNIEEKELATIMVTSIKEIANNNNVKAYYVISDLKNVNTLQVDERKHIVYVDEKNSTYSMTLNKLVNQKYNNIGENTSITIPNSIEKNGVNNYLVYKVSDEEYTNALLSDLMYKILFNKEKAYDLLNDEYKNKKFQSINEFNTFISNNEETYNLLYRNLTGNTLGLTTTQELENFRSNRYKYGIKTFDKKEYDSFVQYIIIDKENKYYIFNEFGTMDYEVFLDSYTTNIEGIKNEYDKLSDIKKYEYEISKYIEMINLKDYESAYNKLDDSIKNSNSILNFENYIKQNFWKTNYVENIQQTESENNVKFFKVSVRESQYGPELKEKNIGVSLTNDEYKIVIKE